MILSDVLFIGIYQIKPYNFKSLHYDHWTTYIKNNSIGWNLEAGTLVGQSSAGGCFNKLQQLSTDTKYVYK